MDQIRAGLIKLVSQLAQVSNVVCPATFQHVVTSDMALFLCFYRPVVYLSADILNLYQRFY